MSLPPTLSALSLPPPPPSHTLELYIDYLCPYSAKLILQGVNPHLLPLIEQGKGGKYAGKVRLVLRLYPQPWHGSGMYLHEAALAVARVSPESFYPYTLVLMQHQGEFFDIPASKMTPLDIRSKLVALAKDVIGADKAAQVADLLTLKGSPNGGIAVTDDLKFNVKIGRQNGIHVTPSALWDGIYQAQISSSWGEKEWAEFLAEKVVV